MSGRKGPRHVTAKTLASLPTYWRTVIPEEVRISCTSYWASLRALRSPFMRSVSAAIEVTSPPSAARAGRGEASTRSTSSSKMRMANIFAQSHGQCVEGCVIAHPAAALTEPTTRAGSARPLRAAVPSIPHEESLAAKPPRQAEQAERSQTERHRRGQAEGAQRERDGQRLP